MGRTHFLLVLPKLGVEGESPREEEQGGELVWVAQPFGLACRGERLNQVDPCPDCILVARGGSRYAHMSTARRVKTATRGKKVKKIGWKIQLTVPKPQHEAE